MDSNEGWAGAVDHTLDNDFHTAFNIAARNWTWDGAHSLQQDAYDKLLDEYMADIVGKLYVGNTSPQYNTQEGDWWL